ncbi:MAG: hypothetical protein KDA37_07685 [Planctomycetales bacterium]|nr:hypothetical protein [Planctomycetales bacterium]
MLQSKAKAMQQPAEDLSVTQWIADLKAGEPSNAQRELWSRYFNRLQALARQQLGNSPRAVADEEDVAVSALGSFFMRAQNGQFPDLMDRNGLWPLLAKITSRKVINQQKRHRALKRGGDRVAVAISDPTRSTAPVDLVDEQLTPETLAEISEECNRLMAALPASALRLIAERKLAGYTTEEIATELDLSPRTIERKTGLIRRCWAALLDAEES